MKKTFFLILLFLSGMSVYALNTPTLSSPDNNLQNAYTRQTLSWNAVSGATYIVEADTSLRFNSPLLRHETTSSTSYKLYHFYYNTTYYWRVRSVSTSDSNIMSEWSTIRSFHTLNTVTLTWDDDDSETATYFPNQTLQWKNSCGSTGYILEVDTCGTFNSPALLRKNVSNSYTNNDTYVSQTVDNLYLGKMQYWRVRAYNN